jgi:hypothetical protein
MEIIDVGAFPNDSTGDFIRDAFIKVNTNDAELDSTKADIIYVDGKIVDSIADGDVTHAPSRNAVFDALALKAGINDIKPATQISVTPHIDYLTGTTVQTELDQTETNIVGLYKLDKSDFKSTMQTGLLRPDTDVSVLTISPADTLTITAVNNILFVNEIVPDVSANKVPDFLKSFGNKVFIANATNTLLLANTRGIFYLGVDKLGSQVYRTSRVYDQDVCYLARILVNNTAGVYTIVSVKYFPDLVLNRVNSRDRLVKSTGYIVPSGAASISFGNRAFSYTKNSINYSNNKFDPNYLEIADSINPAPMSFLFLLPNISNLAVNITPITTIDPKTWYLANGTAGGANVGNTSYQVYKVFITVTGNIAIQTIASTVNTPVAGVNAIFSNRDDAIAGLTSVVFPPVLPLGDSIAIGTFYLRAGTAANGSQLTDPADFYFLPITSSSSTSTTGVTDHDALSNKNINPTFQHVTTGDITNWNDAYTKRITSLTTIGASGAATLLANVLNVPNYTLAGLGGQPLLTNPITGTGVSGQVAFWNGTNTQTGDSGLFWDNTNKRLGIGTTGPSEILDVLGNIKTRGASSFGTLKMEHPTAVAGNVTGQITGGITSEAVGSVISLKRGSSSGKGAIVMETRGTVYNSNAFVIGEDANIGVSVGVPTARVHIAASTTAMAAMRLVVGSAPTTPNDGDVWLESNTNTGLKIRIAGVTKTISLV